jgi:hypothetical protein
MKKILAFIILSVALVSCYDEYVLDYPITGIYFPYQQDVRTFVVGEGMKVEVGATMGGARENTFDRNVSYVFKDSLLAIYLPKMKIASQPHIKLPTASVAALIHMPANYYTISDAATMVIKKGWHSGTVVIKPDSVNFLNDSVNTLISTYALPFYIQSADADTILQPKRTNVVGFKFENKLFGKYWHGGAALINRPGLSDTTIIYKTTIPTAESNVWTLTTASPQVLYTNGYYNLTTAKTELKVVLKGTNVYLSAATGSSFAYTSDGVSTYNNPKLLQKRMLILKYKYTNAGNGWTYHCTDTIAFRNRLRDGINEWQDENPSHYTK